VSAHKAGYCTKLCYIEAYSNKTVKFIYRGKTYQFALSHALFSSGDIDPGSRFLLKVFSRFLDTRKAHEPAAGDSLPVNILDAGCGTGILGICAAGAVGALPGSKAIAVRFQDRDELARIFTEYNALQNALPPELFSAHTEPMLWGPENARYSFILSNIPAKTGEPVLEDFIRRSAGLLENGGRVFMVAVNPLAEFFRTCIGANAVLLDEEKAPGHTVFVYAPMQPAAGVSRSGPGDKRPQFDLYLRSSGNYEMEKIPYHFDAAHGAAGFDSPGGAAEAAAKLMVKLVRGCYDREFKALLSGGAAAVGARILIWEGGQGHFPAWLAAFLALSFAPPIDASFTFAGRNILALEAARRNTAHSVIVPSGDLFFDREKLRPNAADGRPFSLIAAFPEPVPQTDRNAAFWEGLAALCGPGSIVILGFSSAEAERFDRKKPPLFGRLGDIRRSGFRALAYRRAPL
jgi:hypothetical protein